MNVRLILAILTSLIDEIIIIALILWVLPLVGVRIPWWGLVLIALAFLVWAVATFTLGSRILSKKPLIGLTDMQGMEGKTVSHLGPNGSVKIKGEIWKARSQTGFIEGGVSIIVTGQEGLMLIVAPRPPPNS